MADRKSQGIGNIVSGVVLIGVGLLMGGSIFTGNPSLFDLIFDLLGLFFIGRGIYLLKTANE